MTKLSLYLLILLLLFFSACRSSIKPEDLYGKWKYVKLENPNKNPPITEPDWKLKIEQPYIEFSKNNDLVIYWSEQLLAHGKFRVEGKNIKFKETLDNGQTREFPFIVSELTDKTLVFETNGEDGTRVTAERIGK